MASDSSFFTLPRQFLNNQWSRAFSLALSYSAIIAVSFYAAYEIRFDFQVPDPWPVQRLHMLQWIVPWKLLCLIMFGQFAGMLSYFRLPDVYRLTFGLVVAALPLLIERIGILGLEVAVPRGVVLIDFVISLLAIGCFRVLIRAMRERTATTMQTGESTTRQRRVAIIGAGDVGAMVVSDLLAKRGLGRRPVAIFDDNAAKWGLRIHGIPVLGKPESLMNRTDLKLDEIIIAMPSALQKRLNELIALARELKLTAEIVPSLDELMSGRVKASRLRKVDIEDLLGRDPVKLDTEGIINLIRGKRVMVTGAGGSIGSELCRQILRCTPSRLILVEQSEVQLFPTEQQLIEDGGGATVVGEIGDILDEVRMEGLFTTYNPHLVFHAAAHKHVPLMERQPGEAIKNNALGTEALTRLARKHKVEKFTLISTDKAINPTSVMGTTKRVAELFVQSSQQCPDNETCFAAVRFGNVLGSSGSVVPIFRRQIDQGGPITVTHPDVTRYFMTIPEAVGLVLQCALQSQGGEIFVLDMGQPVKIVEMARQMIELSGFVPDVDIEIKFLGLRPGEKLFEELQHSGEDHQPTDHPRITRFVGQALSLDAMQTMAQEFKTAVVDQDETPDSLKSKLQKYVPEYTPFISSS
jgi:FlaA1/EpsC-like NDP-sugar epimerase